VPSMPLRIAGFLAVVALAATFAGASIAPATRALAAPTLHGKKCSKGSVRAVIGGKVTCLRAGARCKKRYERAYERHGFLCRNGRLVRRAKPKPIPQAAKVVGSLSLGATPSSDAVVSLTVGGGAVWAVLADGQRIVKIHPATLTVTATIANPLPAEWPPSIAYGDGALWLADPIPPPPGADSATGAVVRIDPSTSAVVATIAVGRSPEGLAFTPGAVWTANHRSDQPVSSPTPHTFSASKVDVAKNQETARTVVETRADTGDPWQNFCCGPQGATAGAGSIWVADTTTNQVSRIDPSTGTVTAAISNPGVDACGSMAANDTSVWLTASCGSEGLWRIDPASNSVVATIYLPGVGGDVQVAFGSVWASTHYDPQAPLAKETLTRIDPATNHIVGQTPVPDAGPLAVGDGVLWQGSGTKLLELQPA